MFPFPTMPGHVEYNAGAKVTWINSIGVNND